MKKRIPIFIVTKANTDRSVLEGDKVYYSENGDLNFLGFNGGWFPVNELTDEITDFEYKVDPKKEISVRSGRYVVVNID